MKNAIKILMLACMSLSISMISCTKEGPEGPAGPAGPAGINGTDGVDGMNGNANVVSVIFNDRLIEVGLNDFVVPQITQEIFDTGLVLGYVTVSGNEFWETIPVVVGGNVILDLDRIRLGGLSLTSTFTQTLNFRFIIIASSSSTSGKSRVETIRERLEREGVDLNDYYAVMDYFGLAY